MSYNPENNPNLSEIAGSKKGTPKLRPKEIKKRFLIIRVNEEEKAFVQALKEKNNINNLSLYILKLLKNPQFSAPKIDKKTLDIIHIQQLNLHLSRIGNNVNQIAKMLNSLQGAYTSSQILEKIASIESQLNELNSKINLHDSNNRKTE